MSENTINAALRRLGYAGDEMTGHGFRAMARTLLDEVLGYRVEWIEHQLAHEVKDHNGRAYNRTAFLRGRKEMMQAWADFLDGLRVRTNVIPITSRQQPDMWNGQGATAVSVLVCVRRIEKLSTLSTTDVRCCRVPVREGNEGNTRGVRRGLASLPWRLISRIGSRSPRTSRCAATGFDALSQPLLHLLFKPSHRPNADFDSAGGIVVRPRADRSSNGRGQSGAQTCGSLKI